MSLAVDIVKQGGKHHAIESFSSDKLRQSIIDACRNVRTSPGSAELTADVVMKVIANWLARRQEVTSNDLRHKTHAALSFHNPDAAYYYMQYKQIL